MSKQIITVFCATGRQGSGAVRYLCNDGTFHVRAFTRNPEGESAKALAALGAEIVKGDLGDRASIVAAVKGAYGVFGVTDYWSSGEAEETEGKTLVDAAKEAGVKHFVWSTLDHSDLKVPHLETKANVDDYLKASGVPRTSLYTSFFWENLITEPFVLKRDPDGSLLFDIPFASDGIMSAIAGSDCGVIAGVAFKNPEKFIGKDLFAVTKFTTPRKIAKEMEDFLGEKVKIKELSMEQFEAMKETAPEMWRMVKWFYLYAEETRDLNGTHAILPQPTTLRMILEGKGREALLPKST